MYASFKVRRYGSTLEIAKDFGTRKLHVFQRSASFGHVVDVTADENHVLFCENNLALLNKDHYGYGKLSFFNVFVVQEYGGLYR